MPAPPGVVVESAEVDGAEPAAGARRRPGESADGVGLLEPAAADVAVSPLVAIILTAAVAALIGQLTMHEALADVPQSILGPLYV